MPALHHRLYTAVNGLSKTAGNDYVILSDPPLDPQTERQLETFLMRLQPESQEGYAVAMFADSSSSGSLLGLAKTEYSRFEADTGRRQQAVHTHLRLTDSKHPSALLALGQLTASFPINEVVQFPSSELLDEYQKLALAQVLTNPPFDITWLPTRPELQRFLCFALAYRERREAIAIAMSNDPVYPQWRNAAAAISTLPLSLRQACRWGTGLAGTPEVDFFMRSGVIDPSPTAQDAIVAAREYAAFLIEDGTEAKLTNMACRTDIQETEDLTSAIQRPPVTKPAAELQGAPMAKSSKGSASPADPPEGRVILTSDIREELQRQYGEMRDELTQQLNERLITLESAIKQNPPKPQAIPQTDAPIRSWLERNWAEVMMAAVVLVAVLTIIWMLFIRASPAPSEQESQTVTTAPTATREDQAPSTSASTDTVLLQAPDFERTLQQESATAERLCTAISKAEGLETTKSTVSNKQKTRFAGLAQKLRNNEPLTGDDVPAIKKGFFEYIVARLNPKRAITIDLDPTEETTQDLIIVANELKVDATHAKPTDQQFQTDVVIAYINKNRNRGTDTF